MPRTRFIFSNITYICCVYNKKKELNTFRCGRLLASHTVKWKHNLVLSNSQIASNYEFIWYGKPNANKSSNYGCQQDESTARRHLKSPWSLSGSSLHLILVTKRSRSWSWMTPDCSLPITLTPYMLLPLFATRFADYAGASESLSYSHVSFNLI